MVQKSLLVSRNYSRLYMTLESLTSCMLHACFQTFFQKPAKIVEGYDMFACSVQTSYLTTAASLATYSSFTSEDLSTSRNRANAFIAVVKL